MCNRYTPSDLEDPHFKTWLAMNPTNYPPRPWSKLGPWADGPFFANAAEGRVDVKAGQWGLIRPNNPARWDFLKPSPNARPGTAPRKRNTNNARSETMARSPVFGPAWKAGKRCIIPAASFDEPNWESGKNSWWEFRRADGHPWGIAGLWNEWTDHATGEVVPNYTMVTRNADDHPLMSRMHRPEYDPVTKELLVPQDKRSIVPLDPADWNTWLFGGEDEARALITLPPVEVYDAGPEETRRLKPEGSPLRKEPPQETLF